MAIIIGGKDRATIVKAIQSVLNKLEGWFLTKNLELTHKWEKKLYNSRYVKSLYGISTDCRWAEVPRSYFGSEAEALISTFENCLLAMQNRSGHDMGYLTKSGALDPCDDDQPTIKICFCCLREP